MLSMDPQCTHILFSVKNGYKRDLLIMFFCSFLSRTDVKNTMVRRILRLDQSHVIDTNFENVFLAPHVLPVACWLTLTLSEIHAKTPKMEDCIRVEFVSFCLPPHWVAVQTFPGINQILSIND